MKKLPLGVIVFLSDSLEDEFKKVKDLGLPTIQLGCWQEEYFTEDYVDKVNSLVSEYGITISALWCGWPGPVTWNFYEGHLTLGLVPEAYRYERMKVLIKGGWFAEAINVSDVITHVGFIPENPYDPNYLNVLEAVRYVAMDYKRRGLNFLFETGQETPITLKRFIEDLHLDNLGINLDPANLLLYGKANPVDAIDIFGEYVRGVHAKDGEYPTNGRYLGEEKALGEGRVNFPLLIQKLQQAGYDGPITIEREISGEQQIKDIKKAIHFLNDIMEGVN